MRPDLKVVAGRRPVNAENDLTVRIAGWLATERGDCTETSTPSADAGIGAPGMSNTSRHTLEPRLARARASRKICVSAPPVGCAGLDVSSGPSQGT
jgi:hypothetical protein